MIKAFTEFISRENLFSTNDKILLAVSGGIDSVVMCHLFSTANFSFGIAHCNFNLRGEEANADEQFVRELAKQYNAPFYCKRFETNQQAENKGISIQMAARELRYEWFNALVAAHSYDYVGVAHHIDDSIETFFINILRGTGIAGLQGIATKNGRIIRPLLFANKKMIQEYAKEHNLVWREDASNASDKYIRNTIRHNLLPILKNINKGFEKTISKELSYFKDAAEIVKIFIEEKRKEIVVDNGKEILLNLKKLRESKYSKTLLHELLRSYDFTPEMTELIAERMYTTAGKKFLSPTYQLIKDRDFFILSPLASIIKEEAPVWIKEEEVEFKNQSLHLSMKKITGNLSAVNDKSAQVAFLDFDKLHFPITIRKWKQGDVFYPLGMKGKMKLSDFFINTKISINDKEDIHVLESDNKIAWIIGHRIDNRFKVSLSTSRIYKVVRL